MDAETSTASATPVFEPYGVSPYVDRAFERIERHFHTESGDPGKRGEAFVVGVFGEWGSGKSTVLNAIGARYSNQPKPLTANSSGIAVREEVTLRVDFNAWRFEREEHLLVPLLKTVERTLNDYLQALERLRAQDEGAGRIGLKRLFGKSGRSWLADRLQLLGACTIALTRMVKIKAGIPGLGEVELDPAAALKAAQEQIDRAASLSRDAKANPERPLESLYYDLFTHLRRLTRGVNENDNNRLNFVFLIDDLDRCLPEKAVEMLEAIKLFLDVEGCAFVLALDDEVIERGIAHRYRDYLNLPKAGNGRVPPPITGHEYLEKIVQLPFRLPRWSRPEVREFVSTRFKDQLSRWGGMPDHPLVTSVTNEKPDTWLLELIVKAVPPVPRNLVRAIELLEFTRAVAEKRNLGERLQMYPVAQMVLLQLFAPNCFRFLRRGHAQGWKTFEKRLRRNIDEFVGAGDDVTSALNAQPPSSSEEFFDWWTRFCDARMKGNNADPYIGHTERPLAAMLDEARNNRNGFDPRNLILTSDDLRVDEALEPYFSLFAESATPTIAAPSPVTKQVPTVSANMVELTYVEPAAKAAAPAPTAPAPAASVPAPAAAAPAPAAPPPAPPPTEVPSTGSPRDREVFIRQLLSRSPDSWRDAISREDQLIGHTLDDRTVDELIKHYQQLQDVEPRDTAWLELLGSLLTPIQMRRLVAETRFLHTWARKADLIGTGLPNDFYTRLPLRLAFARALDIACRCINPPHAPRPMVMQLKDLDLEGLKLNSQSPELAYRYLRGIEWPTPPAPLPPAKIVWAAEQGFLSDQVTAIEVEPGVIAFGDEFGVIRIFSRAGRGRWECAATLCAHGALVSRMAVVKGVGFVSVSPDQTIAVCTRDSSDQWYFQRPKPAPMRPAGGFNAACQMKDGTVIVGGENGVICELRKLPSHEWEEHLLLSTGYSIMGLAAFGNDSFCEVSRTEIRICKRTGTNWSFSGLQLGSPYSMDVVEWESGVAIVTEAGEIAHIEPGEDSDSATSTPKPKVSIRRLSSSPFRRVFALLEKGLATLGDDGRLRFWLHANEGFELRADFKVQGPGTTCALALCDGRIAYGAARGVLIAAPDITGVWRQDETLGFYGRGVTSIAVLSESRVAFMRDGSFLTIGHLKEDDLSIEYLNSGMSNMTALAAVDADTLAVLEADRLIRIFYRGSKTDKTWVESSAMDFRDSVSHLAASNGRLVAIVRNEPHIMMCQGGLLSEPYKLTEPVPREISAVAINESGRVALAVGDDLLIWFPQEAARGTKHLQGVIPYSIVDVNWGSEAELLCVGSLGHAARVNVDTANFDHFAQMETGGGMALGAIAASGMAVRARGTAPILVDSGFQIYGFHGDVKALVVAGSRLLVGSDALYVIDLDAISAGRVINLRRILVREDWVLNTELDLNGSVRSVHLRRTQGEHWNTQTIGGRPVPDDPKLQACIGTVRANSQLGEITETRNYVFNHDRSIFSMDVVD